MKRKLLLGLLAAFAALQFLRPAKNLSAAAPFTEPDDITVRHPPPPEVKRILAESCYDCHSDHTRYPWYAEVQPVGWWLAHHIHDGRRELNFSEFASYSTHHQDLKLDDLCDEVRDHDMPLFSYTLVHRSARLSPAQIDALCAWAEGIQEDITSK